MPSIHSRFRDVAKLRMNINLSYKIHRWLLGFLEHGKSFILGLFSMFLTHPDTCYHLGMRFLLHGTHKAFPTHDFSAWCYFLYKPQSTYYVYSLGICHILSQFSLSTHPFMLCLFKQETKQQRQEQKKPLRYQEWGVTLQLTALQSHKPRPMKNIKSTLSLKGFFLFFFLFFF